MAEHPIIFSTEMVRAILDGRKTQTRRIIKPQPDIGSYKGWAESRGIWRNTQSFPGKRWRCPYGQVGDRLYVKEGYQITANLLPRYMIKVFYIADESINRIRLTEKEWNLWNNRKYPYRNTSGRFMYKSLARIFLEITNIRVERVQDITLADIKAEGLSIDRKFQETKDAWIELWNSLNAKRGYGWDKNPFVWVIEVKRPERR